LAHSSHHPLLPSPRRPLTGLTPPKFDPRMKRRTTPPNRTCPYRLVVAPQVHFICEYTTRKSQACPCSSDAISVQFASATAFHYHRYIYNNDNVYIVRYRYTYTQT
jgi:hypothetical protein